MNKIADTFCGYLTIGSDEFAYSVDDYKVTLLPAVSNHEQRYDVIERMRNYYTGKPEYIYGVEDGYNIVMLLNSNLSCKRFEPVARFGTPVIIKATGNAAGFNRMMTDSWTKFHAITFSGGSINALYNPQIAVVSQEIDFLNIANGDGTREMKLHKWDKYTRSTII